MKSVLRLKICAKSAVFAKLQTVTRKCGVLDIEKDSVKVVNVSEDDLPDIQNKLRNENFKKSDRYLINLTGGTKMMSIGVFQHFFKFDAEFFYIPISTNKIENVRSGNSLSLKYRVNVTEYLSLYGLSISVSNLIDSHNLSKGEAFEKFVFDSIRKVNITKNNAKIELTISTSNKELNKRYFKKLLKYKDLIEDSFGKQLQWKELPEYKVSKVRFEMTELNVFDESQWGEINEFFFKYFPLFENAFKHYVSSLR